jgi:hypothetical protein
MSLTVLQIGQYLSVEVGIPKQNNLIGSSNQDAQKILLAIRDGVFIDVYRDRDWEMLRKPYDISLIGDGVTTYALPSDFDRIINDTIWDGTNFRSVEGPVDLPMWQQYNKGLHRLTGLQQICKILGDQENNVKVLSFYPDNTADIDVSFWYINNKIIMGAGGLPQVDITSDADTFLVDDKVVRAAARWRMFRMMGMDFSDERDEYFALIDDFAANDSGAKTIDTRKFRPFHYVNIPESGYGS